MGLTTYLLDTNVVSYARTAPASFAKYLDRGALASTTWHELVFGLKRLPEGRKKAEIARFIDVIERSMRILPYGKRAARWHAEERARLDARGATRPYADGQIAAVAHVHRLILVTANVADFEPFEGLTVEAIDAW